VQKRKHTTLLNGNELRKLSKDNLAKGLLGVVGDANGGNAVGKLDPLVLLSVLG